MANDDADQGKKPFHYEGGVPVFDISRLDKLERQQREAESRDREYKEDQRTTNKWIVRFTGALVICAVVAGGINGIQAYIGKITADAARANAEAAKAQAQAARDQAEQMKNSGTDTHNLAIAARDQASASRDTANTARGSLKFSTESLHISQRPYITVEGIDFDPPLLQAHDPAKLKLRFHNSGRSPALKITEVIDSFVDGVKSPQLPPVHPGESILPSDQTLTTNMTIFIRQVGDFDGITGGTKSLVVKGTIRYFDIFKDWHSSTFCGVYDSGDKDFKFCPGTDVE